jgi:ABC-type amino acid transport substrate-binding protein
MRPFAMRTELHPLFACCAMSSCRIHVNDGRNRPHCPCAELVKTCATLREVENAMHHKQAPWPWSWILLGFSLLAAPTFANDDPQFMGLLRARDLTPFGYLRLDMRPSHALSETSARWAIETEVAYQNTWALSPEVERYLNALPGRREIGPNELQAIRDLPGENYLVDLELAQLDVTLHYRIANDLSAYLILSGASYSGGFLDGAIEEFHDAFGFSTFGRTAAARNDVNVLLDLKSSQTEIMEEPTEGGLLDPTIGLRYSGIAMPEKWKLVIETAVKVPIDGRRTLLSTGRVDYGLQATLQRFSDQQAVYLNAAAVYYSGTKGLAATDSQIVPTIVLGYERRIGQRTNAILQAYASPSTYSRDETDLDELLGMKYQLSLGVHHRRGGQLWSFAITENLQNINNTPDIGFQLGWAYVPGLLR